MLAVLEWIQDCGCSVAEVEGTRCHVARTSTRGRTESALGKPLVGWISYTVSSQEHTRVNGYRVL
jgi:hypothetical protein